MQLSHISSRACHGSTARQSCHRSAAALCKVAAPLPGPVCGYGLEPSPRPQRRQCRVHAQAQAVAEQQVDPWTRIVEQEQKGETVEVLVKRTNKGGLIVSLGTLEGFLPYAQLAGTTMRKGHLGDLSYLVGQRLKAKIIQVDMQSAKREIILSEKKAMQSTALARLKKGDVMRGVVQVVQEYGVFVQLVDVPGVSGLVHKSELSWDPVTTPADVVRRGQLTNVMIIDVDPHKCRLSLSIKQLTPDPLKQTLDTLAWGPTSSVPPEIQRLVDVLDMDPGVDQVIVARQAQETRHVTQELQVFMTRNSDPSGHIVVARLGAVLQELQLVTKLTRDQVKGLLQAVVASAK